MVEAQLKVSIGFFWILGLFRGLGMLASLLPLALSLIPGRFEALGSELLEDICAINLMFGAKYEHSVFVIRSAELIVRVPRLYAIFRYRTPDVERCAAVPEIALDTG